jgi:hypothetical protein
MTLVGEKRGHLDLGWRRNEWSNLHIQGASTHKQKNLDCFWAHCIGPAHPHIPVQGVSSFDSALVFKLLETLGCKTAHCLSHQSCTELPKSFLSCWTAHNRIGKRSQEPLITGVSPTQIHVAATTHVCQILKWLLPARSTGGLEDQIGTPWCLRTINHLAQKA